MTWDEFKQSVDKQLATILPNLDEEQRALFNDAIGDDSGPPKITVDPLVNYAVDLHVLGENIGPYRLLSKEYEEEARWIAEMRASEC